MTSFDDNDSGMESLATQESKEGSPKKLELEDDGTDTDDESLEETLGERLWGLTEMFPDSVRKGVSTITLSSASGIKHLYNFTRSAMWIFFSTSTVLLAPIMFEMERVQMQEHQMQSQRQILLGPNVAVSDNMPMPMPMPGPPQSR